MSKLVSIALVLVMAPVIALGGCATRPVVVEPSTTPHVTPSATPTIDPDSAEARLTLFDQTNEATIAAGATGGRDFIDALVAAGFDKSAMQLTPDKTAIGLNADNIQFSVQLDEVCLVGQFGNIGYHSAILPIIDVAGCLIGTTRAIDW